jgi:hypothetical protein
MRENRSPSNDSEQEIHNEARQQGADTAKGSRTVEQKKKHSWQSGRAEPNDLLHNWRMTKGDY